MVSRVDVWVREFLVGRKQTVSVGGQLSNEVQLTSCVPQWSFSGPLVFLVYVKVIWKYIDCIISIFADFCLIYRKITNKKT